MLRIIGHIFTFIYFLAVFLSSVLPAAFLYVADIIGLIAFAIFSLLLARGLTYTQNVFKYFLRLTLVAFGVELILVLAECFLEINFAVRNVIFTYAAALGFIVGLTLVLSSSYLLIMRLETNNNSAGSRPYYKPIQPDSYNLPPWLGLALGSVTMFLSFYASWRMDFAFSIYGILLTACFYLSLLDPFDTGTETDDFVNRTVFVKMIRKSIFQNEKHLLRSFLILLGFNTVYYLIELFLYRTTTSPGYFFTLLVFVPAVLLPYKPADSSWKIRLLNYVIFPLSLIIVALLRYLLVLS